MNQKYSKAKNNNSNVKNKVGVNIESTRSLFRNNIIYIPRYQREYFWKKENVESLFEDVSKFKKYYIGNIVVSKNKNKIELIDGQQRLISLFLFLSAIKFLFPDERLKNRINCLLFSDTKFTKPRIIVEDRTADQNAKILTYICLGINPPKNVKDTNEFKQFENIKKLISERYNENNISRFLCKLEDCQFVVIDTRKLLIKPDQMFLNLNTKGLKLSNESIVRSLIFCNMKNEANYDDFRNSWYDVFSSMKDTEKDNYLTDYISIYKTDKKTKIRKPKIITSYEKIVNDGFADETYKNLVSSKSSYLAAHMLVVRANKNDYIKLFSDSSVKIEYLCSMLSYLKKLNFSQFDIALKSMLVFETAKDKANIKKNLDLIIEFVKLLFLFSVEMGLTNTSPSSYGNEFIRFAVEMKDKSTIKQNIKKVLDNFSLKKKKIEDLDFLDATKVSPSSKKLKYITALISFLDDDSINSYIGEHFIPASTGSEESLKFSNIIPVNIDDYKDKKDSDKVNVYLTRTESEPHIKIFLEEDYFKSFSNKIVRPNYLSYRADRYKKIFIKKHNELLKSLVGR